MSSQVSTEEVQAILDLVQPAMPRAAEVAPRDFRAPHRLSRAQIESLERQVDKALPEVAVHLSTWLRGPHQASIAGVVEADAGVLVEGLLEPLCALAFEIGSQIGFVVWDATATVAAVETALGATTIAAVEARELSRIEERILTSLLRRVVVLLSGALGLEPKSFRVAHSREDLVNPDDAGRGDPQRIGFQIAIQGASGASTLRVYLPGVKAPEVGGASPPGKDPKKSSLPAHLGEIDIELCARLGTIDVPLQELLGLEVGDVVLLGTHVGDPIVVTAEGESCARADLGRHEGRLALRIRSVDPRRNRNT